MSDPTQPVHLEQFEHHPMLGRHMQLDPRSLVGPYRLENTPELISRRLRSVHWGRRLPILDQGNLGPILSKMGVEGNVLGCCVGMSYAGALGTEPNASVIPQVLGTAWGDPMLYQEAQAFVVRRYSVLTAQDPFEGQWPTEDTGTDGLTACKEARSRGEIKGYRTATTLRGLVSLLQDGPVMMGVKWFNRFFDPDAHGRIDPVGWADSGEAGGHEIVVTGVDLHRGSDRELDRAVFQFANHWSEQWGEHGYAWFGGRTYELLRSTIDLYQIVV